MAERYLRVADRYPASPEAREALVRAARVRGEATVDAARATVDIHKRLAQDYPEDPRAPTALLAAAMIEDARLADPRAARATLTDLIVRFPTSEAARTALARLSAAGGSDVPARAPAGPIGTSEATVNAPRTPPRLERIRSFSGAGGLQLILELDADVTATGEWDPNDVATPNGHRFRVTVPNARPATDLELPDVSRDRWIEHLTVLERSSGGMRVELDVPEALEHDAFSLGNRVVVSLSPPASTRSAGPVVIDPGHGGRDPGARSPSGGWEKDVTLAIGKRFAERLTSAGVDVVLTREQDAYVPLEERTAIANTRGGAVLVSIHANAAAGADARGIETYFLAPTRDRRSLEAAARENGVGRSPVAAGDAPPTVIRILDDLATQFHASESRRLAQVVHGRIVREVSALSPVLDLGVKQAPFVVLVGSEMPAMLAEVGFITHPEEGRRLEDPAYQDSIAGALAQGVLSFLGRDRRSPGGPS